ncbi:MAG TPA: ABC transporter permease [Solirubrobacterales bacterium]|jgi:osmoprotectant transport system permease protein|nr:ABC transporter permease [Solirubrobacterales bacterium]
MNSSAIAPLLAQVELRDRSDTNCVQDNGTFCLDWAVDNYERYVDPTLEHIVLVIVSVVLGFLIAMGLAVLSHRRRWLIPTFTGLTGVIYTIPSISLFLLLLPFTGRGNDTAVIALTLYTLQIIYRNIVTGLNNVPPEARDAGRGMGMTDNQLLRRVEFPLATPEIVAGLRIATVSTVAIATLAVFAGGSGLGAEMYRSLDFKTGLLITTGLTVIMAIAFDLCLSLFQRFLAPWQAPAPRERRARLAALTRRPADA